MRNGIRFIIDKAKREKLRRLKGVVERSRIKFFGMMERGKDNS